jgi:hypothetical protein
LFERYGARRCRAFFEQDSALESGGSQGVTQAQGVLTGAAPEGLGDVPDFQGRGIGLTTDDGFHGWTNIGKGEHRTVNFFQRRSLGKDLGLWLGGAEDRTYVFGREDGVFISVRLR